MLKKVLEILSSNDLCVLATCHEGKPHCSLMAYVADEEGFNVYMVTRQDTTKFLNLSENSRVSLLIDTRVHEERDLNRILSLTVEGEAELLRDKDKVEHILGLFRGKYPPLWDLLDHPLLTIIKVKVLSFLLLEGPEKASYIPRSTSS